MNYFQMWLRCLRLSPQQVKTSIGAEDQEAGNSGPEMERRQVKVPQVLGDTALGSFLGHAGNTWFKGQKVPGRLFG